MRPKPVALTRRYRLGVMARRWDLLRRGCCRRRRHAARRRGGRRGRASFLLAHQGDAAGAQLAQGPLQRLRLFAFGKLRADPELVERSAAELLRLEDGMVRPGETKEIEEA